MRISTKGRYALRVMLYLAEHDSGELIPLTEIAEHEELSEKYLEGIVSVLSKNGLLTAVRGKGGGYKLNRSSHEYTVGSILKLTEGSLAPVSCIDEGSPTCLKYDKCRTVGMWKKLNSLIEDFLDSITLDELMKTGPD